MSAMEKLAKDVDDLNNGMHFFGKKVSGINADDDGSYMVIKFSDGTYTYLKGESDRIVFEEPSVAEAVDLGLRDSPEAKAFLAEREERFRKQFEDDQLKHLRYLLQTYGHLLEPGERNET